MSSINPTSWFLSNLFTYKTNSALAPAFSRVTSLTHPFSSECTIGNLLSLSFTRVWLYCLCVLAGKRRCQLVCLCRRGDLVDAVYCRHAMFLYYVGIITEDLWLYFFAANLNAVDKVARTLTRKLNDDKTFMLLWLLVPNITTPYLPVSVVRSY